MNTTQKRCQTAFATTLAILTGLTLVMVGCKDKKPTIIQEPTVTEKIENKVNDALDRRPGEKVLDAIEAGKPALTPQSTGDKIENKINDALDRRPGEKILDAAEEAAKQAKEVKTAVQEAAK